MKKSGRGRQVYDVAYVQNLKCNTNEFIYKTGRDRENKLGATKGEKDRVGS